MEKNPCFILRFTLAVGMMVAMVMLQVSSAEDLGRDCKGATAPGGVLQGPRPHFLCQSFKLERRGWNGLLKMKDKCWRMPIEMLKHYVAGCGRGLLLDVCVRVCMSGGVCGVVAIFASVIDHSPPVMGSLFLSCVPTCLAKAGSWALLLAGPSC